MKAAPRRLVNPITGVERIEKLTFEVRSRTEPELPHRVDLCAYGYVGACSCRRFKFDCEPELRRGAAPSEYLRCWHIKRAHLWLSWEYVPKLARFLGDTDDTDQY
jgi:hypothetical protein